MPQKNQHGNIIPHLGHGVELHARADTGEVLKEDVASLLDQLRQNACQKQRTLRNLPLLL